LLSQKTLKDKVKIILQMMMIIIVLTIILILWNKPYPSMECKCTTTKAIEQIIKSLKTENSYGLDEISTKILKEAAL